MKTVYRVLAFLIAALVFVQAAAVAYGFFGLGKWVQGGGVVDKAAMESETTTFPGLNGLIIHGVFGTMVIPIVALLLLIASFFAKVPKGITWALIIVGTVIVQVALGLFAHEVPALGILHGMVALALLGLAINAGQRVTKAVVGHTSDSAAMANTAPPAASAL